MNGMTKTPFNPRVKSFDIKGARQGCAKKPENRFNRENQKKINQKNRTGK